MTNVFYYSYTKLFSSLPEQTYTEKHTLKKERKRRKKNKIIFNVENK
jgi:hypothetical protein